MVLFAVGLVVRQRVKEIGILKAIGASNWHVTGQFALETAVVAVGAALIGALGTFPLAGTVANGLVDDPAAAPPPTGPGGAIRTRGGFGAFETPSASNIADVAGDIDVAVSPEVFLWAIGIGIALAIVGAIVPAWFVGRVRPAEVLRYE